MHAHRGEGYVLRYKTPIYLAMHEIGVEHFRILLVQSAPCNSKEELHAIEYVVMRQFQQRGVILYNSIIDGRCSEESRAKMSTAQTGKNVSEATRVKLRDKVVSEATREKLSKAMCKRGCVSYNKTHVYWSFIWHDNGARNCKSFSVKKYGTAAHGLALFLQEEMYPIEREDDSELIREIRARIEA